MLSRKERVYLAQSSQQAALRHVMRYYERENGNWDRIKEAEVEISLIKNQYILKGSVDLIRGENEKPVEHAMVSARQTLSPRSSNST
jgi:DNA helicase-2/ATP-dependent DNA helicase PcrA